MGSSPGLTKDYSGLWVLAQVRLDQRLQWIVGSITGLTKDYSSLWVLTQVRPDQRLQWIVSSSPGLTKDYDIDIYTASFAASRSKSKTR